MVLTDHLFSLVVLFLKSPYYKLPSDINRNNGPPKRWITSVQSSFSTMRVGRLFFSFSQISMKNRKKKSECGIGNGDCDFGARPIKHTARVLSCEISFVQLKTYLAESCDFVSIDRVTRKIEATNTMCIGLMILFQNRCQTR